MSGAGHGRCSPECEDGAIELTKPEHEEVPECNQGRLRHFCGILEQPLKRRSEVDIHDCVPLFLCQCADTVGQIDTLFGFAQGQLLVVGLC